MAYKRSVYVKAKDALDARKAKAERQQEIRHSEIISKCPQIAEIENEIASYGAKAVKSIGMGADAAEYIMNLSVKNLEAQRKKKELLAAAGYPQDYLETTYFCPKCKDTGSHDSYYCECYLDLIKQTAKDEIKASASLKQCTFDNFKLDYYSDKKDQNLGTSPRFLMSVALEHCKNYAENFTTASKGIAFIGKTGLGKTHLSLAIVNRLVERGFNVYYDSAQGILDRLQKAHFSNNNIDEDLDDDIYKSDALIIDDLGTEFSTTFTVSAIYNLINTRINNGVPTIISTNMSARELEERYSQRFTSRVFGTCDCIQFYGRDIRQIKASTE